MGGGRLPALNTRRAQGPDTAGIPTGRSGSEVPFGIPRALLRCHAVVAIRAGFKKIECRRLPRRVFLTPSQYCGHEEVKEFHITIGKRLHSHHAYLNGDHNNALRPFRDHRLQLMETGPTVETVRRIQHNHDTCHQAQVRKLLN